MDDNLEALPLLGASRALGNFIVSFSLFEDARYFVANSSGLEESAIGQGRVVRSR